jgi:hypothetical protein
MILFLFATTHAGAKTMSVEEFMQNKAKWDGYAKLSTPLTIEGRVTSKTRKLIHLAKCEVSYRPKPSQNLPDITGTSVRV